MEEESGSGKKIMARIAVKGSALLCVFYAYGPTLVYFFSGKLHH